MLAYIEAKQTQGKKISRTNFSFNKFVKIFDILLYF